MDTKVSLFFPHTITTFPVCHHTQFTAEDSTSEDEAFTPEFEAIWEPGSSSSDSDKEASPRDKDENKANQHRHQHHSPGKPKLTSGVRVGEARTAQEAERHGLLVAYTPRTCTVKKRSYAVVEVDDGEDREEKGRAKKPKAENKESAAAIRESKTKKRGRPAKASTQNEDDEFEVESILQMKDGKWEVRWKGFVATTWETFQCIQKCDVHITRLVASAQQRAEQAEAKAKDANEQLARALALAADADLSHVAAVQQQAQEAKVEVKRAKEQLARALADFQARQEHFLVAELQQQAERSEEIRCSLVAECTHRRKLLRQAEKEKRQLQAQLETARHENQAHQAKIAELQIDNAILLQVSSEAIALNKKLAAPDGATSRQHNA